MLVGVLKISGNSNDGLVVNRLASAPMLSNTVLPLLPSWGAT
jgi:hypothetical protein